MPRTLAVAAALLACLVQCTGSNRLYAHVRQVGHDNDRSYAYGYDALSRLRQADLGVLSSSPPWQIVATPGVPSRSHTWTPDVLGNWTGDANDPNYPGLRIDIDADGNGQSENWITTVHEVNPANQITQIARDDSQVGDWVKQPVYDRAGNLVWDGRYFFQYDGFNRLVQVYSAPSLQADCFDAEGRLGSLYGNLLGAKLAAFTYDGLGRLIRTQRWRSGGATQVEDYYYDGVRRIQEVETTAGGTSPGTVTREYVWGPGYADEMVCQLDYSADPLGGTGVEPETYYYLQDANYNVVAVVAPASGPNPPAVLWQYTYGPYGDVLAVDAHSTLPLPVNRIGHQGLFFERLTGAIGDPALLPSDPAIPRTVRGLYHSRNRWLHVELGRFLTRDPAEAAMPIIIALAFNGDTLDGLAAGTATLPFSPTGHYGDGFNLYQFVGSNPVNRIDPLGLSWDDPFNEIDAIIMAHSTERATALAKGMAYWQSWAIMAARSAVLTGLMATGPLGLLAASAYMVIEGTLDVLETGELNWENGTQIVLGAAPWVVETVAAMRSGMSAMEAHSQRLSAYRGGNRMVPLGVCFAAGTLVLTPNGAVPIETLDVGERVLTTDWGPEDDPFAGDFAFDVSASIFDAEPGPTAVDPATWRLVELAMPNPTCPDDIIVIHSLRPLSWLADTGCAAGRLMWYTLPEMGLAGWARVRSVAACPPIEEGPGRVVLSTVTHFNGDVRRVWLDGLDGPLEPTGMHRLYSEDWGDWVAVADLTVGERLRTLAGPLTITQIDSRPGVHRVYNLEVETEHCYFVSTVGVLSHNAGPCDYNYQALKDAVYAWAEQQGLRNKFQCYDNAMIIFDRKGIPYRKPDYITRGGDIAVDGQRIGNVISGEVH